ncbi:hypothetical protein PCL_09549 [Purpureocillium lilacinum]|uniref:Uncharacterized protein n=1 Tax=Purpureocillium lilacinum TaxID=33203 RepID=A0A2U3DQP4_PURLI|nr:hypothetical protein Purlil1_9351 [Purpureocillium lilacinum]PWI64577.1 hypothetical protein PCL_09549 [Purpureocillium lilacinum]
MCLRRRTPLWAVRPSHSYYYYYDGDDDDDDGPSSPGPLGGQGTHPSGGRPLRRLPSVTRKPHRRHHHHHRHVFKISVLLHRVFSLTHHRHRHLFGARSIHNQASGIVPTKIQFHTRINEYGSPIYLISNNTSTEEWWRDYGAGRSGTGTGKRFGKRAKRWQCAVLQGGNRAMRACMPVHMTCRGGAPRSIPLISAT